MNKGENAVSYNDTSRKKAQFSGARKNRMPLVLVGAAALIACLVLVFSALGRKPETEIDLAGQPVAAERSYVGRLVSMTVVEPVIEEEKIILSLEEIDAHNIVYFEAENSAGEAVPIMAYITPSGRLFVGSSMCEPCQGRTFSLAGETLVCDTCRTTYNIETREFISGSVICGQYPPVDFEPTLENGKIVIERGKVLEWRNRAL